MCFLFFHKWETKKDTGINRYQECLRCGKRRIVTYRLGGYQPIDRNWLNNLGPIEFKPPSGGTAVRRPNAPPRYT